jgi:hypothetical protein
MNTAHLKLPNGHALSYTIRPSTRAKYLRMQLHPSKGLLVTQPPHISTHQLHQWVSSQQQWIVDTLHKLALNAPPVTIATLLPERLELLATSESLQVVYTPSAHRRIALHYVANATLTLSGAISDPADCQRALRHWLRGYAQVQLSQWLQALAAETGLQYSSCRVKGQQTRWGSCSSHGTINLNEKLLLLPPEWVRYTLIHELCHTVEMNHSKRFWALVATFVPDYRRIHAEMKGAMSHLPEWIK